MSFCLVAILNILSGFALLPLFLLPPVALYLQWRASTQLTALEAQRRGDHTPRTPLN